MALLVPEPAQWLARYGDELYRYALSRVASAEEAQELVQDTLCSALDALASFRGEASERTWLFVILRRKVVDFYRRQARSPFVPLPLLPEQDPEAEFFQPATGHWQPGQGPADWAAPSDEDALEQQEFQAVLRSCQQRLSPQHGAVFVLRFAEELSAEEICAALQLTAANYWVIVHRLKLHLRRCLEKNWFGSTLRS
ncbi:sigma-70 family RNA polymerase sigma factor [Hymenobacter sp. APR13]|uniref:sigma-70 family RNA polymerase sigma factor n=1 Tax=Hymenobacter sp. APR13 TaxID=1356852 RepID=UPI0004E04EA3|nr:sigma-70 family RNA polymerase sigma factor [Hymenobacter sp. APR13]AII53147.1 hypothetical protein N008_14335 [Hymenobacter sp. APR13]